MKRGFDVIAALMAGCFLLIPAAVIALVVRITSSGPSIYWSRRIGKDNRAFEMPKFRSMRVGAPAVASHLLEDPACHLTPVGGFLRRTSLDEIPQLWSVLRGDMTIVGPRPALFNQHDLIRLRTERGIHQLVPGLTGWAQVNGRDDLPIATKVAYDHEYVLKQSVSFDLTIIARTVLKVLRRSGVSH
jgi:O-antigen biosynthesis protein WbqP